MTFELPVPERDDPRWTRTDGIFVRRNEGITKWVMGDTTTVKITAAQTNGALGVLETTVSPGGGAVAHSHGREEEASMFCQGISSSSTATRPSQRGQVISCSSPAGTVTGSPISAHFRRIS